MFHIIESIIYYWIHNLGEVIQVLVIQVLDTWSGYPIVGLPQLRHGTGRRTAVLKILVYAPFYTIWIRPFSSEQKFGAGSALNKASRAKDVDVAR